MTNDYLDTFIRNDITFCISPCDHKECFRHISNLSDEYPKIYTAADLKDTAVCPFTPENIAKAERFHEEESE